MQDKKPDVPVSEDSNLVIVTTPEYVKDSIKEAIAAHAESRNHPYATQAEPGFVTLNNEVNSDSELTVATSKAVKTAYDLANTANQNAKNANESADNANDNANTRLAKDQNGADIPNKGEFVKNLGLEPRMEGLALPVGVPVPWPTENPPEGWLICNGDSFDKAKYPKLAIAYPSGKLPDLRSEFIRGADAGRGIDPTINVLSAKPSQIQSHTHDYRDRYYSENSGSLGGAKNWEWQPDGYNNSLGSGRTDEDNDAFLYYNGTTSSTGGTETHPRYIAFLYIVKAA
ncbi:phage tail protein [Xenorhabdus bovienii]|uniref:phage tail protein n=1 Tax=Xenorhabdus bovienii TaxID=40576 RepID=UPI0023B2E9B4|nr:tail fiber protein [Xenorhabdus bovienii]MDE9462380.1 phage tail protein [Xenorhabdus bovienii]MDE9469202.1 phage tail protein [Xenorhabdus bovienii]